MPVVIPRLIVEVFQHTNFRGRMGYVVEPVPFTDTSDFKIIYPLFVSIRVPTFRRTRTIRLSFTSTVTSEGRS